MLMVYQFLQILNQHTTRHLPKNSVFNFNHEINKSNKIFFLDILIVINNNNNNNCISPAYKKTHQ